jgi:hypothetical protein
MCVNSTVSLVYKPPSCNKKNNTVVHNWHTNTRPTPSLDKYRCLTTNTQCNRRCGKLWINPFVTSGTYIYIYIYIYIYVSPTYKKSFQVRWGNSIPTFLHAAIYLEVFLFRWTSQNAFSRETAVLYKWYSVQCCIAALHTVYDYTFELKCTTHVSVYAQLLWY